jgi:hypothetical protein
MAPGGEPPRRKSRSGMTFTYVGSELDVFSYAHRWKAYWAELLRPYLGPRVLEVGAGIGANIPGLFGGDVRDWVALEPDTDLARQIERRVASGSLPENVRVTVGRLDALKDQQLYDAILYIDVLEHILDDVGELIRAADLLESHGRLIVLAPAHQWLFSPFDAAIGHHRRYNRSALSAIGPACCRLDLMRELDCIGLLASLANKMLLRQAIPSKKQIEMWDRALVPLSRWVDPLTGYRLGKSILAVWCRN